MMIPHPHDEPLDPRDWSDQRKLGHSMAMAEKLIDSHPLIAELWLKAADIIRKRMPRDAS